MTLRPPLSLRYGVRIEKLQQMMMARLLPRRERLESASRWCEAKMDEVRCARLNVERETAADVEAIRERLRAAESLKMAALQQAGADVRAEVEAIDRLSLELSNHPGAQAGGGALGGARADRRPELLGEVDRPGGDRRDAGGAGAGASVRVPMSEIGLIHRYPELCAEIERVAARPMPPVPDVRADDLPRDARVRLEAVEARRACDEALEVRGRASTSRGRRG